jgi:hypothetical protein
MTKREREGKKGREVVDNWSNRNYQIKMAAKIEEESASGSPVKVNQPIDCLVEQQQ